MAKTYAVWLEVEEIDEEAENYETLDLPFGRLATFDSPEKAMAFASGVQHLHERGGASELLEFIKLMPSVLRACHAAMGAHNCTTACPDVEKWALHAEELIAKAEGVDHG